MELIRHLDVHRWARPAGQQIGCALVRGVLRSAVLCGRVLGLLALMLLGWTDRLVYLVLFGVEAALLTRVFLKVVGADATKQVPWIDYAATFPIVAPFAALPHLHPLTVGAYTLEPAVLVALAAYVFAAWLLVVVLNLVRRLVRLVI